MNQLIKFTEQLIKFQSTDDNPQEIKKCLDTIEKKFGKNLIVKKYNFRNRPILVLSNTNKKEVDIILAGHVDVVPAEKEFFTPKSKGNKLYGRGSRDMKGPLVASLFAFADYLKHSNNLKVAVLIVADEELDGLSTKYLTEKIKYKAKFAILPDGGDETEIITHQKGFLQLKIIISGKNAHASRPWESDDPIKRSMAFYGDLLKKFPNPTNKNDWKSSINLTKIKSGKTINQIPGTADLYFDIRYINKKEKKNIVSQIKKILGKKGKIEVIAENGALTTGKNNPYITKLKKYTEKITGKKVKLTKSCGTSDAVFLSENGTPSVLFLPKGGGEHQNEEWVNKTSLIQFYKILSEFLKNI